MSTMTAQEPTFLFPTSRQYPFDKVCEQIVRSLEARMWDVPGITVDFDVYGTGDAKYRLVRSITGDNFRLRFGRPQGRLGRHYSDTAAVSDLVIPGKELHVFEDFSGPRLYVYTGRKWLRDRERFMNGPKINSKLHGERRLYLVYRGELGRHGSLASMLVHDNDRGREHDRKRGEPQSYKTADIFAEFTQWLKDFVLARILRTPETNARDYLPSEEYFRTQPEPWTQELSDHIGPIFCFGEDTHASRIASGQSDRESLSPEERYAFYSGYRLVALGDGTPDTPQIAREGFMWCGLGEVSATTPIHELVIPGHNRRSDRETYLFRVKPKSVDGIYIADHGPYEAKRKELSDAITDGRDRFTDDEVRQFMHARAVTIMPIVDYAMMTQADPSRAYSQPIILITREVGLDEVELVSGPWPYYQFVRFISEHSAQARVLLETAAANCMFYLSSNRDDVTKYSEALTGLIALIADNEDLRGAVTACPDLALRGRHLDENFFSGVVYAAQEMRELGLF